MKVALAQLLLTTELEDMRRMVNRAVPTTAAQPLHAQYNSQNKQSSRLPRAAALQSLASARRAARKLVSDGLPEMAESAQHLRSLTQPLQPVAPRANLYRSGAGRRQEGGRSPDYSGAENCSSSLLNAHPDFVLPSKVGRGFLIKSFK